MDYLTAPAMLLSLALATGLAGVFQWWQGKRTRDALLYWAASAAGFLVGQAAAEAARSPVPTLGQVHVLEGAIFALAAMFVVKWLKL